MFSVFVDRFDPKGAKHNSGADQHQEHRAQVLMTRPAIAMPRGGLKIAIALKTNAIGLPMPQVTMPTSEVIKPAVPSLFPAA